MAKKELRRAARGPQAQAKTGRVAGGPPTVRSAIVQGVIMAAVYFVVIELVARPAELAGHLVNLLLAVFFFMLFAVFTYYWQGFLYRRRQRRRGEVKR